VVVIDNNSTPPYPTGEFAAQIIRTPQISYAGMMNTVPRMFEAEWYLILNNDTICRAPFLHLFQGFNRNTNYGCRILKDDLERRFIETWMIIFSHQSWERIGPWDEEFKACGFEDADYGFRAAQAGVDQVKLKDFPFIHLPGGTRWATPRYDSIREDNIRRLISKWGGHARMTECD
jgi:hypothetical protein